MSKWSEVKDGCRGEAGARVIGAEGERQASFAPSGRGDVDDASGAPVEISADSEANSPRTKL